MRVRVALLVVALSAVRSPAGQIVVLGDSVAHGAGDESGTGISGFLGAIDLAVNGSRTYDLAKLLRTRVAQAAVRTADRVILSIGGNDLFGDRFSKLESLVWPSMMMANTIARVDRLVRDVHRLNPAARVYLLGFYNPYRNTSLSAFLDRQVALWDSRLIAHFANQPAVDVVRIADLFAFVPRLSSIDHFHPGHRAYALIAQRIAMTW